jgi:hypothetical protein
MIYLGQKDGRLEQNAGGQKSLRRNAIFWPKHDEQHHPQASDQFKQARNRWLRAIRKAKRECWERFLQVSDPATVWKSINSKPQPCAIPPILTSPSGEQYQTIEEKWRPLQISHSQQSLIAMTILQTASGPTNGFENQQMDNRAKFQVCANY